MNGVNVLKLNAAEMQAAKTLYLKTKVLNAEYAANIEVQSVEQSGGGYEKEWTIKLVETAPVVAP